jgi:endo-1,4-beta-xylanase
MQRAVALLAGLVALLVVGGPGGASAQDGLRAPAERAGLVFGSAAQSFHLSDRPYESLLRDHAGVVTFENETKWGPVHPEPERYDFAKADRLARWAWRNGQRMRGHTLIWHVQNPQWLKDLEPTRDEAIGLLRDHIFEVVGHFDRRFPGMVVQWDVVNEAIDNDGTRRANVWQRWIGDDYVGLAFRFAREAAGPEVELYLNDYFDGAMMAGAEGLGGEFDDGDPVPMLTPGASGSLGCDEVVKCSATRELVTELLAAGAPIDGVGFQGHMASPTPSDYRALTSWVGPLGLEWAITEADRPIPADSGAPARDAQAQAFAGALRACVDDPACDTFVLWGLADRYTWWRTLAAGALPDALPFDQALQPKPAFEAIGDELEAAPPVPACARSSVRVRIPRRVGQVRRARAVVVGSGTSRVVRGHRKSVRLPTAGASGDAVEVRLTLRRRGPERPAVRLSRELPC